MKRLIFILSALLSTYAVSSQDNAHYKINWPSEYEPSKSAFYVHNEIEVKASPNTVWSILIDALKWESWYKGAKHVKFNSTIDLVSQPSSIFRWQTMGLNVESTIKQYEPYKLLAWESKKKSIRGFHVWLIIPTSKGCRVITDESQNGWLTFFEKTFQGKKLEQLHDVWLLELKKRAEVHDSTSQKS